MFTASLIVTLVAGLIVLIRAEVYQGKEVKHRIYSYWILGLATACFLANIEKIETFVLSWTELKVQTREAKITISEAKTTIKNMKTLAAGLMTPAFAFIGGEGRYGGSLSYKDRFELMENLMVSLKEMKLSEKQIEGALWSFDRHIIFDHVGKINGLVSMDKSIDQEIKKKINEITAYRSITRSTPEKLKEIIMSKAIDNIEIQEAMKDLDFYLVNRKLRRPEMWETE